MGERADRRFYEFGSFRLDPTGRILFHGDRAIPLPPKAADTLLLLVENAGNVVEKHDLLKQVWHDALVEEGSVTRTISILRKALEDCVHGQEFISTVPTRGYRFAARVHGLSSIPVPLFSSKVMLAVLPFENMSGRKTQEYFSDGLTEEMITQLGRLNPESLGVIARTSAMQYKNTTKTIHQIGQELNVSHIVEGSVRRANNRVRIAAQLIQVSDQTHLWAESYERDLCHILQVQSDVARAIAAQIEIKLTPREQARLARADVVKPEAYEAYLKGRYLWNRRNLDALHRSVQHFQKAVKIDSEYAAAYAGLADSYLTLQDNGHMSPRKATALAKKAVQRALRIDETLAEAHNSLAHACFHQFDWSAAERAWKRAIELNPNYATAHLYYANYLLATGQIEAALAEARRAQMLDPASLAASTNTASILNCAGQCNQAIELSRKTLETDPSFARAYEDLGRAYEGKMMHGQAITALQNATKLSGGAPRYRASLAHGYAVAGNRRTALRMLNQLKEMSRRNYVSPYSLAVVAAGLGDKDRAFRWLAKAYRERSEALPFMNVDPRLIPLHSDPRFLKLVQRVGLPA
jgi:TolB-like protein/Flp pilus assembly protein TadD